MRRAALIRAVGTYGVVLALAALVLFGFMSRLNSVRRNAKQIAAA